MLSIGDKFQHSFTVTDKIYQGFIDTFDDKNPLHTDEDFAISKGFAGKVMHGNILGGFLSYFIGELLAFKNVAILKQSISFANPVYLSDIVDLNAEVKNIFESVNMVEFAFKFTVADKKVAKGSIEISILK